MAYSSGKDVTVKILHGNGMQKSDHDAHNDITSLCISQDPSLSNACVCTCCHETNIARTHCIVFKESQYNMTSDDVKQALSCRYHIPTAKEFVCRTCDQFLLKSSMPPHAMSSPTKPVQGMRCLSCCRPPSGKMYFLDQTDYGDHPLAHEIMQKRIGEAKEYVCSQCHHAILGSSLVPCLLCAQKVTKKNAIVFNPQKYPSHATINVGHSTIVGMPTQYVCRACHSTKQVKYTCVCCERVVNKNMCIPFNEDEYDFNKYIIYK